MSDDLTVIVQRLEDAELLLDRGIKKDAMLLANSISDDLHNVEQLNAIAVPGNSKLENGRLDERSISDFLKATRRRFVALTRRIRERRWGDLAPPLALLASIKESELHFSVSNCCDRWNDYFIIVALAQTISILDASYGLKCNSVQPTVGVRQKAAVGNVTSLAELSCEERPAGCEIAIAAQKFGDSVPLCAKEFRIVWNCSNRPGIEQTGLISAEAQGKSIVLNCPN